MTTSELRRAAGELLDDLDVPLGWAMGFYDGIYATPDYPTHPDLSEAYQMGMDDAVEAMDAIGALDAA